MAGVEGGDPARGHLEVAQFDECAPYGTWIAYLAVGPSFDGKFRRSKGAAEKGDDTGDWIEGAGNREVCPVTEPEVGQFVFYYRSQFCLAEHLHQPNRDHDLGSAAFKGACHDLVGIKYHDIGFEQVSMGADPWLDFETALLGPVSMNTNCHETECRNGGRCGTPADDRVSRKEEMAPAAVRSRHSRD
jgi:hypothetical protein